MSRADVPRIVLAAVAAIAAVYVLAQWLAVLFSGLPIGYGEGAVAHAGQILARGGNPYALEPPATLVSANYPPLAYVVAAAGSPLAPFTALRAANIAALLAVAGLVAWRARASRPLAVGLGASFVALFPVAAWGSGARVDQLAVACTAFAVVTASAEPRRAIVAGVLAALAMSAKPTAAVPLLAVAVYLVWRERRAGVLFVATTAIVSAAVAVLGVARFGFEGLWRHLVVYNAFPYDLRNPVLLVALGALLMGAFVTVAFRGGDGRMRAYLVGAAGVVILAGHEGASVNYLLDLAAAALLALAPVASTIGPRALAVFAAQIAATVALIAAGPLAPPPLALHAARVEAARTLPPGPIHVEDSGVVIAAGIDPPVDDSYVWARVVELGLRPDEVTPRAARGELVAIVSDVALDRLDEAPHYQRQRWPAPLVAAVLQRYRLDRHIGTLWIYVPR